MEVKVAATAGFCYGVSRAVSTVYEQLKKCPDKKIFTYGPIVHNDSVVSELNDRGVRVINDREELSGMAGSGELTDSICVIRAHGIGNDEMELLKQVKGLEIVDATCPFVTKIHTIVEEHHKLGEQIIVTGDRSHPEVMGIIGCVSNDAIVISEPEDAKLLSIAPNQKICLVSQTTFNARKFEDIVEILKNKMYDIRIVNTICNATQRRQSEAAALSRECDAMIVIGGRNSSNTAKLFDICRSSCRATYYIQCLDDLRKVAIRNSVRCIGITAGASTPKTIIEEVLNYVRTEF
ncbi:MAG: 4-hydroxy-3-methylbut-2-enyl diphosphate reductase [Lachnospiraceae bacterium]|nr:4-hydroxy-3-methylbut-2-enyl diphosphate reductase [Lachnospiraceae bacterium]